MIETVSTFANKVAIDMAVGGASLNNLDEAIETVLNWAHEKLGRDQIVKAKEEFFWKMGKVFHDDNFFHSRMSYFTDYLLFQRVLDISLPTFAGMTIYNAYNESFDSQPVVSNVCHSLFQILKVKDTGLAIKDLISEQKIFVLKREMEHFHGISRREIFQGFLYQVEEKRFLSRGLVFHPLNVNRLVKKQLKKAKKLKDSFDLELLSRLARQQLRYQRHLHVEPKRIYSEDP